MGVGLYLLSLMEPETSTWLASLYMFVLGTGIGLCMQVLTIAVQNTVDYAGLGTATSGVTFFRTLGSSFGTAVFGTIYANSLGPRLANGVGEASAVAGGLGLDPAAVGRAAQSPAGVHGLPDAVAEPIVNAYADTLHTVFLWTVPVAAVGFVVALFPQAGEAAGLGARRRPRHGRGLRVAHHVRRLGEAPRTVRGRILRRTGPDTARRIVDASDTRLDAAGAWAVMQVELYTRTVGHASLGLIAAGRRVPPEVLLPVFDRMVDEGFLTRDGSLLSHTPAGEREARVITRAWGSWLADRVERERGRPSGPELRVATDAIAKKIVAEDLASGVPRSGSRAVAGAR